MNCWEVLGLEPTEDVKLIKKAYAAKLKKCRPDQDPIGFQKLRESFDFAKQLAQNGQHGRQFDVIPETDVELDSNSPIENMEVVESSFNASQDDPIPERDIFQDLQSYYDVADFDQIKKLVDELCELDNDFSLVAHNRLEISMLMFLDNNGFEPEPIVRYIAKKLNWTYLELPILTKDYDDEINRLQDLLEQIHFKKIAKAQTPASEDVIDAYFNYGKSNYNTARSINWWVYKFDATFK